MIWDFSETSQAVWSRKHKIYHYTSGIYLYTSNNGSAANLYTFFFPTQRNIFWTREFFFNVLTDYLNEISTDLVTELDFNVMGLLYIIVFHCGWLPFSFNCMFWNFKLYQIRNLLYCKILWMLQKVLFYVLNFRKLPNKMKYMI